MNYFMICFQGLTIGFTIAWLWRGYLEAKRCPRHHSMWMDPK